MSEDQSRINRVRGTRDVLPTEYEFRQQTWRTIADAFERFGYRGVEVPTIELVDLHLRKSGEAIRQHMYTFHDLGQEHVCLRPELTASVSRMYNAKLQDHPLPLKLYYAGSSFRYDRPQIGRYREFTQAGVELIGGSGPEFDAEVIALACHVMDSLGIENYQVVIGNIGIILELLSQKKIEERVKNTIVESMEALSKTSDAREGIKEIWGQLERIGVRRDKPSGEERDILEAVRQLPEDHTTKVVAWVLQTIYGATDARRAPDEIARNLLLKMRRDEQLRQINETTEFISKLTQIGGNKPSDVFHKVDMLIQDYNLDARPIDELRAIAQYLSRYQVNWDKVRIDFGFGRGLQYYTGMIFEIYVESEHLGVQQKQVCGGGRYDSLIADLGGRQVPALGFSFGLERLTLCLAESEEDKWYLDAFVAPIGQDKEFGHAIEVVEALRNQGLRVDIGTKGMPPRDLAGMAKRLKARHTLFLGEDEISKGCVSLKDMTTGKQVSCSISDAIELIKNGEVG